VPVTGLSYGRYYQPSGTLPYLLPTNLFPTNGTDISPNWLAWLATIPDGATIKFQPGATYGFGDGYGNAALPTNIGWNTEAGAFPICGRTGLTIDLNGAQLTAVTQGGVHRNYFLLVDCVNCTLTDSAGGNLVTGPLLAFPGPGYDPEFQSPVLISGGSGIDIEGINMVDSFGYFISTYDRNAGVSNTNPAPANITIDSCTMSNNTTQGIAFVCVDTATVTNTTITAVTNCIDIESSFANELTRNITIGKIGMGNTFGNVSGGGTPHLRPSARCISFNGYGTSTSGNGGGGGYNGADVVIAYNNLYGSNTTLNPIIGVGDEMPAGTYGIPGLVIHDNLFGQPSYAEALISRCDAFQFYNNTEHGNLYGGGYPAVVEVNQCSSSGGACVVTGNSIDTGQPGGLVYGVQGSGNNHTTTGLTTMSLTYSGNTNWPATNNVS